MCRLNTLNAHIRIAPVAVLLMLLSTHSASASVMSADILAGETLYYTIDFWLLRGSAEGELCFTKTPGGYTALLRLKHGVFFGSLPGIEKKSWKALWNMTNRGSASGR